MPANIAHMLIAHKAIEKLKLKNVEEFTEFAAILEGDSQADDCKAYMNIGSIGPDLFYYSNLAASLKDVVKDGVQLTPGKILLNWQARHTAQEP